MDALHKTEDPLEIFQMVLRSLESHRPAKAEKDILDQIASRFDLRGPWNEWPDELTRRGVSVEDFLKYTLELLGPFVEMILDIFAFLHDHVSTTGGRTQHFLIDSDDLAKPWTFDVSRLPRQVQWISAWMDTRVEEVAIDWSTISSTLGNDNGIFYGTVEKVRLIQSLIIARREGPLSNELRAVGDRVYEIFRRASRAWYGAALRKIRERGASTDDLLISTYLPSIDHDFGFTRGGERGGYVGMDLDLALNGQPGYGAAEVFGVPELDIDVVSLAEIDRNYAVESAVYFCALWGLDESSFRRVARLLTAHEERDDLLFGYDLEAEGERLGELLARRLSDAIKPTGNVTHSRELTRQRLEILLLPYWKDRWFLFEVWTLVQVLRGGQHTGARLDLKEVTAVADPDTVGTVWHLPTQKAKSPVASLSSPDDTLLVWFQRETPRHDMPMKNMEPDVRLTSADTRHTDIAIVECKDRIKFGGARANTVVESYRTGSSARLIWLVNYEGEHGVRTRVEQCGDQSCGVASAFRPHGIPRAFRASLSKIIWEHLKLKTAPEESELHFLIIDVSSSMDGKALEASDLVRSFIENRREHVMVWNDVVRSLDEAPRSIDTALRVHGSGAENGVALERFARGLPPEATLTVITDDSGRPHVLGNRGVKEPAPRASRDLDSIGGRPLEIVVL